MEVIVVITLALLGLICWEIQDDKRRKNGPKCQKKS